MTPHAPENPDFSERGEPRRYNGNIRTPDDSPEAFARLLAQGRGLAALVLQRNDPAPYADALLDACLHDRTLRWFGNGDRAGYLLRLLDLAKLREVARDTLIKAAPEPEKFLHQDLRNDLLGEMASEGNSIARAALLARAEKGDRRAQDRLSEVDEAGLEWVAENVLPGLDPWDRYRISRWLPEDETDDATSLQHRLRGLHKEWREFIHQEASTRPEPRLTASGYFRTLDGKPGPHVAPVTFDRLASMRQWRIAARRFLRERDVPALKSLAQLYEYDTWPLPLRRLFRQATQPERGWAVMKVLGTQRDPRVRRFALGLLRRRPLPWNALEAISANLRRGDEPLVLAALQSLENHSPTERHNAVIDVLSFLNRYPRGGWRPHAEWVLAHSATAYGRKAALDWLVEQNAAPAWFLEEAPYDAGPDIRETVAKLASPG